MFFFFFFLFDCPLSRRGTMRLPPCKPFRSPHFPFGITRKSLSGPLQAWSSTEGGGSSLLACRPLFEGTVRRDGPFRGNEDLLKTFPPLFFFDAMVFPVRFPSGLSFALYTA